MTKIVSINKKKPDGDLVEYFEELLEKAKSGKLTGIVALCVMDDELDYLMKMPINSSWEEEVGYIAILQKQHLTPDE